MGYITQADLEARFGVKELTERTDDAGLGFPDAARVGRAITDAEAEVDGYLAARYTLPLPVAPEIVKRLACDIARYRLWEDAASEEVRRRYEDARRLLESISRGLVALGLPATTAQPAPALAAARGGNAPVFDQAGMAGF